VFQALASAARREILDIVRDPPGCSVGEASRHFDVRRIAVMRYAHTFQFTNFDDPPCVVRYLLKEVDRATEFTLINENVPVGTKSEKYLTQGSTFITEILKSIVENGRPTPGGRFEVFMMGLFAPSTSEALPQRKLAVMTAPKIMRCITDLSLADGAAFAVSCCNDAAISRAQNSVGGRMENGWRGPAGR
jgi:hypothetical protein